MNKTMTLPMNASLGESLAFLAFPAKRAAEQVSVTTDEIVKGICVLINQVLRDVISTRSKKEFRDSRAKYLGRYMQMMTALGGLVSASVNEAVIERLTNEALSEIEVEFESEGHVFGEEVREQAIFTAWTLRKINDLVQQCNSKRVEGHLQEADLAFAREYVQHVLYARFHLDCLRVSLATKVALFPEPLAEISDGLRATVDAYAWVRQGRDLRHAESADLPVDLPWDEEQEELLQLSTSEMMRETY